MSYVGLVKQAKDLVSVAFEGKFDKGGNPYMLHLLAVAEISKKYVINDVVQSVALLHDLLEDCDMWNEDMLRLHFSDRIVNSVVSLTKTKNEEYSEYLARVSKDPIAIIVKISDLEHNMNVARLEVLGDKEIKRLKKYHTAFTMLNSLVSDAILVI